MRAHGLSGIPLEVQFDTELEQFFFIKHMTPQQFMLSHERINLTVARKPLNGYRKGKCFYCYSPISIKSNLLNTCDIDPFVPLSAQFNSTHDLELSGVWNLVLSCQDCNRGEVNGKFARLPEDYLLQRFYKRNEYLVESNHPLKETIIMRTGKTRSKKSFINTMYRLAISLSRSKWQPKFEYAVGF